MQATELLRKVEEAPDKPGVYLFKDAAGRVLYVGKAASLRKRLRSYFQRATHLPHKVQHLMGLVAEVETILTPSEQEALILECSLIKRLQPPYNTRLRDDKNYPYIKIDLREEFPQVYITRRVQNDGARYFGPFASAGSVRRTLALLKKLFPYRSCTKRITGRDPRPCLEYYIHRCVAPCAGLASREDYHAVIQQVIKFLEGRTEEVVDELWRRMEEAAERLEFERAAALRDQINAIRRVTEAQVAVSPALGDLDTIALAPGADEAWVEVFFVRNGKVLGRDRFVMDGTGGEEEGRVLAEFIKQFYTSATFIPPRVLVPTAPEEAPLLQEWLAGRRGGPVRVSTPQGPEEARLMRMARENAQEALRQRQARLLSEAGTLERAMEELQEALGLPRLPRRIECYDISNIRGTSAVGSMVVFQDGQPHPAHYRRFQIKEVQGIDDYAMMREVLRRRFRRLARAVAEGPPGDGSPAWSLVPDLVLIDGGRGHLNAALEVFLELGLSTEAVPLASIAKEEELLFVPQTQEPIYLPRNSQALFLVQRVRDEAHRFAITYHRRLRSRRAVQSALDLVPGIGPKRKKMLLRRFGSVQAVRSASVEELASVPGITPALAQRLKEFL